ncbi:MAG: Ig-like domain-containing protein [Verrucomicrobiales bacterium]|nr:Ig-like domain-containing protein [Verrucomicrobiales bacterium]
MKQQCFQNRFQSALSLVEVLMVVSVLGILAGVAMVGIRDVSSAASKTKIGNDLNVMNSAVGAYLTFGGSFEGDESLDRVLTKLKARASGESAKQIIGLAGHFLDPRYEPLMQTAEEAATDMERIYWKASTSKFVSATSGPPGVKGFQISDDYTESQEADSGESRESILDYATESKWIWDYEDVPVPKALGPTVVATVPVANTSPAPVSAPVIPTRPTIPLSPPTFSVPPGTYPITDFSLPLAITNPNSSAVSELYYSIDYGDWNEFRGGTVAIAPGSILKAQAVSTNDDYISSGVTDGTYGASPATLLPPMINLSSDAFNYSTVETINVRLVNPNDSAVSRVDYRLNGGSWLTSAGGSFSVRSGDYPFGVMIEAYTVSTAPYYLDSTSVAEAIGSGNTPPHAGGNGYSWTYTYTGTTPVFTTTVLVNDWDVDGDTITVTSVTDGAHGTVTIDETGNPLFTSSPTFIDGKDSFTYTISDGRGGFDTATVNITANAKPVVENESITTTVDTPVSGNVLSNDWDHGDDPLFVEANENPSHGTVTISSSGNFVYTPGTGYSGPDSFRYTVADPEGGRTFGFVNITVEDDGPPDFFGLPLGGDILFVIDVSTSMNQPFAGGTRLSETVNTTINAINSLSANQKFGVLYFSGAHASANGSYKLVPASPGKKRTVIDSLNALATWSGLGTNYEVALTGASLFTSTPDQIIFLSDGAATGGNHTAILAEIASRGIPINTVDLDATGAAQSLLEELATATGGESVQGE